MKAVRSVACVSRAYELRELFGVDVEIEEAEVQVLVDALELALEHDAVFEFDGDDDAFAAEVLEDGVEGLVSAAYHEGSEIGNSDWDGLDTELQPMLRLRE